MNKVLLLAILITVNSTAFSQLATDTSRISFPYPIAKMIAKDLVKGDSAMALLPLKDEEIKLLEKKVVVKDSIISAYKLKEVNYQGQVSAERQKVEGWQDSYKILQKQNKKLSAKLKFTKIVTAAIIGTFVYLQYK